MRFGRGSVAVVGGLVMAAGLTAGFYAWRGGRADGAFRTAPVERGTILSTVSATGTLNAVVTVQVGSQISGTIRELHADFNSKVKKGQLVARIDPEIFEAKVAQAKADLESARANVLNQRASVARAEAEVATARANAARQQVAVQDARIKRDSRASLFREGGVSQEERDSAQASYDAAVAQHDAAVATIRSAEAALAVARAQLQAAEAQVAQRQAALRQAQVDLEHTFIRAPVDGIVISRNVDVGQTVAASLQAPVLFTIAQDLSQMQVDTNVDEADISRIQMGQDATFTVDSFPGQSFRGNVVQVRSAPIIVQNVVTYNAVVAVANPDPRLKPGMTANVRVLVARRENVLRIPNAALRVRLKRGDEGGARAADSLPGAAGSRDERARAAPPSSTAGAAGGTDGAGGSLVRRLAEGLGLSADQQTKISELLREARRASAGAPAAGGPGLRPEVRERIAAVLTADQRTKFQAMAPAFEQGRGSRAGGSVRMRVWVLGPDRKPNPIQVVLGLTDGVFSEVVEGDLREGQPVIVADLSGGASQPPTSPFGRGPRF
jgi:HlyD family secretion protein